MQLQTLGGLRLLPSSFTRPKPLVLLSYLTLEGPQQRKNLAELFWQDRNPTRSLSMALTLVRQGAGEVFETDTKQVKTTLPSDVRELLEALDKNDWTKASELYTGAFLEGVVLDDWSTELEEWVYQTREYLAERVQSALLNLAEGSAKKQDFETSATFAERAYMLPGLGGTDIANLKRLYSLLCAGNSLLAPDVRKEAESYGVTLQLTTEEARALFTRGTKTSTTLPMRGTSFVGRDVELTELATALNKQNTSLVTLLGTAGVGKTRLALQLAHEQQKLGAFKDGVYFVALESVTDASLIASTLLNHLGLTGQGKTEPLQQLIEFFGDKQALLVLDNFEQLTTGALVLSLLLSNCPNLKILVTSRETLKLEEEHVFALEGLSVPPSFSGDAKFSNDAKLTDAVQLFRERAQQLKPQFGLDEQLPEVIRICQLLEGLPLGIELAASWIRMMPCSEIAEEIERGLELLTSSSKNIPERHRSLRAAFQYSWQLLTQKEQETLGNLAVFRGGFQREAASEVAGATIPVLASLVDKSLLRVFEGRYDFHPLLQQFVAEKLAGSKGEARAKEQHARYFSAFLGAKRKDIPRSKQNEVTDVLAKELANFDLMWQYLSEHRWLTEIANLATATFLLHYNLGRLAEGAKLFTKVRASLDSSNPEHYFALGSLCVREAGYLKYLAAFSASVAIAEEGLGYLQRSSHPEVWVKTIAGFNEAGVSSYHLGQFQKAKDYYERAIALATKHNDARSSTIFKSNLANLLWHLGEYEKTQVMRRELLEHYRAAKDWEEVASGLCSLATVKWSLGEYKEAKVLLEEGVRLLEQHQLRASPVLCELHSGLGIIHGCLGNKTQAYQHHEAAMVLLEDIGSPLYESSVFSDYGDTLTLLGDFAKAETCLKKSLAILWQGDDRSRLLVVLLRWAKNELAKGETQQVAELLGLINVQPELAPKDRTFTQELFTTLQTKVSQKDLKRASERGKTLRLEHVVTSILHGLEQKTLV
jgi:predicted ATPase